MTEQVDATSCVLCKREFSPQSKPRWAFHPDGRPAGRIHAGHAVARGGDDL